MYLEASSRPPLPYVISSECNEPHLESLRTLWASEQTTKWKNPVSSTCGCVGAVRCEDCRFISSSSLLSGDGCRSFKADCSFLYKHLLYSSVCTHPHKHTAHTQIYTTNTQSSQARGELKPPLALEPESTFSNVTLQWKWREVMFSESSSSFPV